MKFLTAFILTITINANIVVASSISSTKKWTQISKHENVNIKILLNYLNRSKSGRDIIILARQKAKSYNLKLEEIISSGQISLTDTTLYRKFNPNDPNNIQYETKSVIKLNKNLSQYDALLDLAHELTHFVHRDEFNPYRTDFTLEKFIKSTIEAKGGEVHAFMTECLVIKELFPNLQKRRTNCKKITDKNSNLSHEHAVEQFYSVGEYYKNFKSSLYEYQLVDEFKKISNNSVQFVSSAYGLPYPVAAMHEYNTVMKKVCENDFNRYIGLKKKAVSRSIASVGLVSFKDSITKRCKNYL